jgi:hypothetical protein
MTEARSHPRSSGGSRTGADIAQVEPPLAPLDQFFFGKWAVEFLWGWTGAITQPEIGAGRAGVARQLLMENLALSLFVGGLGLFLVFGCLRALIALAPTSLPRVSEMALDIPVLGFAAAQIRQTC